MVTQELSCNSQIDYSTVKGNRVLPFFIELDLESSILYPNPGQFQRFCYQVTGIGQNTPQFTDLGHLVLGICNQISEDQIVNISVFIDGEEQDVDFGEGGNVELRPQHNPDPLTGSSGLKFDFGLNKLGGIMEICLELATPYPIGPNPVYLFGGNTTAKGLSLGGPSYKEIEGTSTSIGFQPAIVSVPVTVKPFAIAGMPTTYCCGDPIITPNPQANSSNENGSCSFTITQKICVAVPINLGATTSIGATLVEFDQPNSEGCKD